MILRMKKRLTAKLLSWLGKRFFNRDKNHRNCALDAEWFSNVHLKCFNHARNSMRFGRLLVLMVPSDSAQPYNSSSFYI